MSQSPPIEGRQDIVKSLTKQGHDFFCSLIEDPDQDKRPEKMPEASFLFISELYQTGRGTVYDVYRSLKDEDDAYGCTASLPLQSAYRSAKWLTDAGYIAEAGASDTLANGITKNYYELTPRGIKAFHEEAYRHFRMSLASFRSNRD